MTENTISQLSIRVLGRLEVRLGQTVLALGTPKQRQLLALLLLDSNKVVTMDSLLDALWDGRPPRTARKNIQVYVLHLRKVLGDRIHYRGYGYVITVNRSELDLFCFEDLVAAGRRDAFRGDREGAARTLGEALSLWNDRPLIDLHGLRTLAEESERMNELFLSAFEDWAELELELGQHGEVLDRVDPLAARFPERERLTMVRMSALARCGRATEAFAHYERLRQYLSREMGIEPSPIVKNLYRQLLRGADPLATAVPDTDYPAPPAEHNPLPRPRIGSHPATAGASAALRGPDAIMTAVESWFKQLSPMVQEAATRVSMLPASGFTRSDVRRQLGPDADPEALVDALIQATILTPPDAEVTAHGESYVVPWVVREYCRSRAAVSR